MPKTTNYNLEIPDDNSIADIAVINNNMDIVDTELFNKVDKEVGKGLSSNDFTNEQKQKLAELSNFDSSEIDEHLVNKSNPHSVTIEQIGATPIAHASDSNNPHRVTANQVGATPLAHATDFGNPHGISTDQIGALKLGESNSDINKVYSDTFNIDTRSVEIVKDDEGLITKVKVKNGDTVTKTLRVIRDSEGAVNKIETEISDYKRTTSLVKDESGNITGITNEVIQKE
ncbi:hypothetical protein IMX26_07500 [Clostridium sp. 'deep sea']|uniref:hypothetical protein n=1 Tax=Clostridium sp. 'deep sea' TaxID=2779445 RepID=UPI001896A085|nr:hypothetical protein [Clostridium sp. 'deep sea']QOR36642.1 hypothetical protein IMX26_07500 [Clostridium sp. 'deep sea']